MSAQPALFPIGDPLMSKERGKIGRGRYSYSPDFEEAWGNYPKRKGPNPKTKAYRAYCARLRAGHTHREILAGVRAYAAYCKTEGKISTPFVYQAATFFGPDLHFTEDWAGMVADDPLPKRDEDLLDWGAKRGLPARAGETWKAYRDRLEASL